MTESPMPPAQGDRPYDIVLLGATGYTGKLTADYLNANLPAGAKWALAGRNADKLDSVARDLDSGGRQAAEPGKVIADVSDPDSMRALAESTRVVITTVGPYLNFGEPVVAACAAAGTDYVDLTGEPEFVDRMYLAYNDLAEGTGSRLVHCCGFDSVPYDIGVYYTMKHVPEGVPVDVTAAVWSNGQFSGGTYHSAVNQFSRLRGIQAVAKKRREKQGPPTGGRRVKSTTGRPYKDELLGRWLAPLPTIDPQVVLRSAAALEEYGPKFSYGHYASTKSPVTIGVSAAVLGGLLAASQVPPLRKLLLSRIDPGSGPSEERRARSRFHATFVAKAGGRTVVTRVSGGDPGYTETSMMLAESGMALAFDDVPEKAGQLTTAEAMGEQLLKRVEAGGLTFEVLED